MPLLLIGLQAQAQETDEPRWYQIELVVFEIRPDFRQSEEQPLDQPPALAPEGVRTLALEGADQPAFVELPREAFALLEETRKIEQSRRYQLLTHLAWRQPVADADQAVTVRIPAGTSALRAAAEALASPESAPMIAFEGNISVSVSRYLHLKADIIRRERTTVRETVTLAPAPASAAAGGPVFQDVAPTDTPIVETRLVEKVLAHRLTESRRMRSKRLHYLDHPVLGVLALITPYEPPAAPPEPLLLLPPPAPTPGTAQQSP